MATTTETRETLTFDNAYMDGVDVVTAAVISADRAMIARLAAVPTEAERFASIVANPKTGRLAPLAYRGWLAGMRAAVLQAMGNDPHFANLVKSALQRQAAGEAAPGQPAGKWMVCSACGDLGIFQRRGEDDQFHPVACGYCAPGKPVARKPTDLRVWSTAVLTGGR